MENRFLYTNLNQCSFRWKLARMASPDGKSPEEEITGNMTSPDIKPGHKGELITDLPTGWSSYDVLYITASDPHAREIFTWSRPITLPSALAGKLVNKAGKKILTGPETASEITLNAGDVSITLRKQTGLLERVTTKKGEIPFHHGPVLCAGEAECKGMIFTQESDTAILKFTFSDASKMKEIVWKVFPSGKKNLYFDYGPYDRWQERCLKMTLFFGFSIED